MDLSWSAALSAQEGRKLAGELFEETFGYQPLDVWSAPGRVNVIGEHVYYNGGPCLPIALPHRAFIAYAPREDRLLRLVSPQTREAVDELDLDKVAPRGCEGEVIGWASYLSGVAWRLRRPVIGRFTALTLRSTPAFPAVVGFLPLLPLNAQWPLPLTRPKTWAWPAR